MNRFRLRKLMLLTLTCCLAFAVTGAAQVVPIGGCGGTSTCSTVNCGSASACTITIGEDSNGHITLYAGGTDISATYACVSQNTTIQWAVASSTAAGFIVEFSPNANPFGVTTAPIFVGTNNTTTPQSASVTAGSGTCSEYSLAYCGAGNDCITADPKVIVNCSTGMCKPPPKAK